MFSIDARAEPRQTTRPCPDSAAYGFFAPLGAAGEPPGFMVVAADGALLEFPLAAVLRRATILSWIWAYTLSGTMWRFFRSSFPLYGRFLMIASARALP